MKQSTSRWQVRPFPLLTSSIHGSDEDSVGCLDYAIVTNWCFKEGVPCTPALRQESSLLSLQKIYKPLHGKLAIDFWIFLSNIFEKLHNQVRCGDCFILEHY